MFIKPDKEYLGDSVYVDFDGCCIELTTDNGLGPSNTICMELEVFEKFVSYAKRLKTAIDKYREDLDKE